MKEKKCVVLGVCGGIAAYKAAQLTGNLIKKGYDVEVIMTKNATEFITPLTFESLTKHNVMVTTFDKVADRSVKHIALAQRCDVFVVVPATANIIAKIAHGLADDMLTTTFLAAACPKIICPAMNTNMYENVITQRNLALLKELGMEIVEPQIGRLACGDEGKGRLCELSLIEDAIEMALYENKPLKGKRILISAGPTQEAIDPIRFISNHSTGKMGIALAWVAKALGGEVTLVHGPIHQMIPYNVKAIPVNSAQEMLEIFQKEYVHSDVIIKAAAVSDYRCAAIAEHKIKKSDDALSLAFIKNADILQWLGEHKQDKQILCGFAMETEHLIENAKAKLQSKHCDLLIANNLKQEGAGFATDTNIVTILTETEAVQLPCMDKRAVSEVIWKQIIALMEARGGISC